MPKDRPKHRGKKILKNIIIVILILSCAYTFAIYSDIPFIAKWRTIYIETAMGTFTHKWLATAFIPQSVIDEAMKQAYETEGEQSGMSTGDWSIKKPSGNSTAQWNRLKNNFSKLYPEIDIETLENYINENDDAFDEDGYLFIDKSALNDSDTGIKTIHGDRVLALDTRNGIIIIMRKESVYVARMAIVKNPEQVSVALSPNYGSAGATIQDICESDGAILGINASGFDDPAGKGNGGKAYGLLISDGKKYSEAGGGTYKMIGFDHEDTLCIGSYKNTDFFRDAVEFKPILVLDGERKVDGSAGWGVQPRSAIGQKDNGEVFLLIVDGRAPGYSIGATMQDMADFMLEYNVTQAVNLDGGSSSIMYYNGKIITKPSAGDKVNGRRIPDAFVVAPAN